MINDNDLIRWTEMLEDRELFGGVSPLRDWPYPEGDIELINEFHRLNANSVEKKISQIGQSHNVKTAHEAAIGIYRGVFEPAYILTINGRVIRMIGMIAEWGQRHDQNEVILCHPLQDGQGIRYVIELPRPLNRTEAAVFYKAISDDADQDKTKLSATLIVNPEGLFVGAEYWGGMVDDDLGIRLVYRTLLNIIGTTIDMSMVVPILVAGHEIVSISKADYPRLITASVPDWITVSLGCDLSDYVMP